ncbi:MAG TPA: hypothetical protein DDZ38_12685 [Gammaproteobacteria bacterium]|nr:hypothetical protein [Gammaproteobacteria bacterium]
MTLSASWFNVDGSLDVQLFVNNTFYKIGISEFMIVEILAGILALAQLTQHRFMGLTVRYMPHL